MRRRFDVFKQNRKMRQHFPVIKSGRANKFTNHIKNNQKYEKTI